MRKYLVFLLFIVNALGVFLSVFFTSKIINAQSVPPTQNAIENALPTPYVPCDETKPEDNEYFSDAPLAEFHSLRPYQASPCYEPLADLSLFCGNNIIVRDTAVISQDGDRFSIAPPNPASNISPENCVIDEQGGRQNCTFLVNRDRGISINLDQLDLPVLGNTQNVRNITNNDLVTTLQSDEEIDDAQKVNNYVSWYLNGLPYHAEYTYPFPNALSLTTGFLDENRDQFRRIIDYSGPLNKLLPQRIQYEARERQIDAATGVVQPEDVDNPPVPRHNQVVICTIGFRLPGWVLLSQTDGQIGNFPVPCNTDSSFWLNFLRLSGSNAFIERGYRIGYWQNEVRRPPKEEDFQSVEDYILAVNRWRGQECSGIRLPATGEFGDIIIPSPLRGIGFNICYDDPADLVNSIDPESNESNLIDAEFFQYIPYSSTEDRAGEYRLQESSDPIVQEENVEVLSRRLTGETFSDLYLPHIQESEELSDLLQSSYVPQDLRRNEPALETDVYIDPELFPYCQTIEVRDGPIGDDVFADSFDTNLSFQARVSCEFPLPTRDATTSCAALGLLVGESPSCVPSGSYSCRDSFSSITDPQPCGDNYTCGVGCRTNLPTECTATTAHVIDVNVDAPLLDSIWARLVAGPSSVFRRIMPKVGPDSFVTQIWDMPGATFASYSTTEEGVSLSVGDPSSSQDASSAEVYFPHLGGIYEYFLQCIQKGLRPEGFGQGCISATGLSGSILPRTAISCTSTGNGDGTTPGGNTIPTNSAEIIGIIRGYGLPEPVQDTQNGARGYEQLYNQLIQSTPATSSTRDLLTAEDFLINRNIDIFEYLTSAWIWYETGSAQWPDPYLYNCDDGEDGIDIYNVSSYCYRQNRLPDTADFLIQVAGFQATENRKNYRESFEFLYGNNDGVYDESENALLRDVLERVINNSQNANRTAWMYTHSSQERGMVTEFMDEFLADPTTVSLDDISDRGIPTAENSGLTPGDILESTQNRKTQFFTFILGKDPRMAIYLNNPPQGGVTGGNIVSGVTNRQILSNMIYALWMFDSQTPSTTPPPSSNTPGSVCLDSGIVIDADVVKYPRVASGGGRTFMTGINNNNVTVWEKADTATSFGAPSTIATVGGAPDRDQTYKTTDVFVDSSGNPYVVYIDVTSRRINFVRRTDGSWTTPTQIYDGGQNEFPAHSRIAVVGSTVLVVWADNNRIWYSFSTNQGSSWSQRRVVENADLASHTPALSTNGETTALSFGGNNNVYVTFWDNNSLSFANSSVEISAQNNTGSYQTPAVTVTPSGRVFTSFYNVISSDDGVDIIVSERTGQNSWNLTTIAHTTIYPIGPAIASDSSGGLHVFWAGGSGNTVFYSYGTGTSWQTVTYPVNVFNANADIAVSSSATGVFVHGVVELFRSSSVLPGYFLFRAR